VTSGVLGEASEPRHILDPTLEALANQVIARIDAVLNAQLDAILHHPKLIALEAAWRGLHLLVEDLPRTRRAKVCVLNVKWKEVVRDLERALEFDQSALFWLIYTTEFDMPGGEPLGTIICDFQLSHKNASDMRALKCVAAVAEASFCVMLFPTSPSLLGMNEFADLHPSVSPKSIFRTEEYLVWRSIRDAPSSRFLGFMLPRALMRRPWGEDGVRRGAFPYRESCDKLEHYVWAHPGFVLARVLLREFDETGWFAHVRGAPRDTLAGGIVVDLLPTRSLDQCDDQFFTLPSTDVVITDYMERELSECGFISLAHCWQTAYAAFLSLPSLYRMQLKEQSENAENEKVGSQLQNVLCASRFAHYIKVLMRDKIGTYKTAKDCERFLVDWIREYCTGGENLDWETRARYPLRSATIKVHEDEMSPGSMRCNMSLSPHYQYDGLVGEINMSTEFPSPGRT
jgi:type VI secretion system protein ImpD